MCNEKKEVIMMTFTKKLTTTTAALALLAIPAFAQDSDNKLPSDPESATINEMLTREDIGGTYKIFTASAGLAGLSNMISDENQVVTLFVPDDAAFAKLPPELYAEMMDPENIDMLRSVINYHLVAGSHPAAELAGVTNLDTLHGSTVKVITDNGMTTLDDNAHIVKADIAASNGIIHTVDTVFIPNGS